MEYTGKSVLNIKEYYISYCKSYRNLKELNA
jgi:hypothetical protein